MSPSKTGQTQTSICLLVFATSRGQVAAAAMLPATNPAEKFAPKTLAALPSSPTNLRSLLRFYQQTRRNVSYLVSYTWGYK